VGHFFRPSPTANLADYGRTRIDAFEKGAERVLRALSFFGQEARLMTTESALLKMKFSPHVVVKQMRVHGWSWTSGGAAGGLSLGILCPLMGSILTAVAWFTGPVWHGLPLHRGGAVLLFLTVPFLIFGGHCLDLMDKQAEKSKKSRRS
jgi:hypothetical protein